MLQATSRDELVFLPLGGSGEIGMNFNAYGFGPPSRRKWIILDCGVLFGREADTPGVDVIMPDVQHCGGLLELTRIAALAQADGISVAPHNPSGPISTAASVQICAGMANFRLLELQWGEIGWRSELITPGERFEQGFVQIPERPGFGISLNDKLAKSHPV